MKLDEFIIQLSSKSPTPGGGGASALIGAVGTALCSMVANLTSGKQRYAEYQKDIDNILLRADASTRRLMNMIQEDAEAFKPLSEAYNLPREIPGRDEILEKALVTACSVPMKILKEMAGILDILEQLCIKGSRSALSDVGTAASACRAALEGAAMNIYVNTRLMKCREYADNVNNETREILSDSVIRCENTYQLILVKLREEH